MKEILNKIIKIFEPELNIFIKFKIIFKTIDNKEHESIGIYNWIKINNLNSIEGFVMNSINFDKYIIDSNYVIYPLDKILEIKIEEIDKVAKIYERKYRYQNWFKERDINKMKDIVKKG